MNDDNPPETPAARVVDPGSDLGLGGPMRMGDPMRHGAVWCVEHGEWECAQSRSRGRGPCHGSAIAGLDACRMHSGLSLADAKARGQANIRAAELRRELYDPHAPAITDPMGELARFGGQLGKMVDVLGGRVNALESLDITTDSGAQQVRAVVGLFRDVQREYRATLTDLMRAGVEERAVRLEEGRQELVVRVIHAALGAMLERVVPELREGDGQRLRAAWPVLVGEVVPVAVRGELERAGAGQDRRSGANGAGSVSGAGRAS